METNIRVEDPLLETKAEDKKQKTKSRRQKAEDKKQKTKSGRQKQNTTSKKEVKHKNHTNYKTIFLSYNYSAQSSIIT
jgi:hypothetical protein